MATSTIKKMLKSKEVTVTITSGQTAGAITNLPYSRVISIVPQRRNEDWFHDPVIYMLHPDGTLECRTTTKQGVSAQRTYTFLVWYI